MPPTTEAGPTHGRNHTMARQKSLRRAAAVLALAGAGAMMVATAGTASALPPGDCHFSGTNSSGEAICTTANSFRVYIVCTHAGTPYTVFGPWVGRGGTSSASCNIGDTLKSAQRPASVYAEVDL